MVVVMKSIDLKNHEDENLTSKGQQCNLPRLLEGQEKQQAFGKFQKQSLICIPKHVKNLLISDALHIYSIL